MLDFDANVGDVYLVSFSIEAHRDVDTAVQYVINIVKDTDDFNIDEI